MSSMATPNFGDSRDPRSEGRQGSGWTPRLRGAPLPPQDSTVQKRADALVQKIHRQVELLVGSGDLEDALRLASRATRLAHKYLRDPRFAVAMETEGALLLELGQAPLAKNKLNFACEILFAAGPEYSRDAAFALEKLGELELRQGHLESAVEYFTAAGARRKLHLEHVLASGSGNQVDGSNIRGARLELADALIRSGWCRLMIEPQGAPADLFAEGCKELCEVQGIRGLWATGKTILRFSNSIPASPEAQSAAREQARGFLERCRAELAKLPAVIGTSEHERVHELRVNTHGTLGQLYVTESLEGRGLQSADERAALLRKAEGVLLEIFSPPSPTRQGGVITASLITLGWVYLLQDEIQSARAAFRHALKCCTNANTSEQQILNALSATKGLLRILAPTAPIISPQPQYQPLIGRRTASFAEILNDLLNHAAQLADVGSREEVEPLLLVVARARRVTSSEPPRAT